MLKSKNNRLQPHTGDEGGDEAAERHEHVGYTQGLQTGFHVVAHVVRVNPEIAVIRIFLTLLLIM